jgi:hypothetical protein
MIDDDIRADLDDDDDGHPVFCSHCEDAGHLCEMELGCDHWACPHCDYAWWPPGSTDPGDPGRF